MERLIDTEIAYVKCFSKYDTFGKVIRFFDDNISDMYTHNFTLIKDEISKSELIEIINNEIDNRRSLKKSYLQVELDFVVDDQVINSFPIIPRVTILDYMMTNSNQHQLLKGNDECTIEVSATAKVIEDGIKVDVLANSPTMGNEFAKRRIKRKVQGYQSAKNLNLYVCYYRKKPVGNCELFINGLIGKIEDFDILKDYQRKGLGTTVLKTLIKRAEDLGAKKVYLITDHDDTAKEMYKKCGLSQVGQKMQLHFPL